MKYFKGLLYALTVLAMLMYIVWRAVYTLPFQDSVYAVVFGVLLLFSEIISSFTAAILIWSKHKVQSVEKPVIEDAEYPHIDVFIVTHNEDTDLLYKTVNACINMRYPDPDKVHIYFADDTNRTEVKALAEKFGVGHLGLENNQYAKSGNLNYALSQTHSPLVATFDADMIPYSDFLLETVPYFINQTGYKKKLGLVQTPQSFYNPDLFQFNFFSEDNIPNEQDFFSREVNVLNNAHDAAVYTGSNTVILRKAIVEVGGFPTDTVTEDFELGAMINAKGYRSLSTLEPMASGLTPMDIPSMFKQRIRWARGVIRSVHNLRILTNKDLTFSQKMVFLNSYFYWWSFLRRIIYILAPIMFTVFNTRVVVADIWQLLIFWLPGYLLLQLTMRFTSSDIRTQSWGEVQETIFAPYLILPVFLETIGVKETKFKVTDKNTNKSAKQMLLMLPHLILLILSIIGFMRFNHNKFGSEILYGSVVSFWLLVHMFNLLFAVLFFVGRPLYRSHERFKRIVPLKIRYMPAPGQPATCKWVETTTRDLSEKGLAFASSTPYYVSIERPLEFLITTADREIRLSGIITRERKDASGWQYGVALHPITEEDTYRQLLTILYDGYNHNLPLYRDPWVTPLDRLFNILKNQLKRIFKQPQSLVLPERFLRLNEPIILDGNRGRLIDFDFDTVTIAFIESAPAKEEVTFSVAELSFELELKERKNHLSIYKVINRDALLGEPAFQTLIEKWIEKEDATDDTL